MLGSVITRAELTPSPDRNMFVEQSEGVHPSYELGDYDTDAENSPAHREGGVAR